MIKTHASGKMVPRNNLSKIEQVYVHIIRRAQDRKYFGKTLFYKILYFSDFDHYEKYGESITGDKYRHINHGPAPCSFDRIIKKLKGKELIHQKNIPIQKKAHQIRYHLDIPDESVNESELSQNELIEIDRNTERLLGMTAKLASEYSNQDMPVKSTKQKEIIDYDLVHYRNPMFSVSDNEQNRT